MNFLKTGYQSGTDTIHIAGNVSVFLTNSTGNQYKPEKQYPFISDELTEFYQPGLRNVVPQAWLIPYRQAQLTTFRKPME